MAASTHILTIRAKILLGIALVLAATFFVRIAVVPLESGHMLSRQRRNQLDGELSQSIGLRLDFGEDQGSLECKIGEPIFDKTIALLRHVVDDGYGRREDPEVDRLYAPTVLTLTLPSGHLESFTLRTYWITIDGIMFEDDSWSDLRLQFAQLNESGWSVYPDGSPRFRGEFKDQRRDGHWQLLYNSGGVMAEGNYVGGFREGLWREYAEDGSLSDTVSFHSGVRAVTTANTQSPG